MAQTKGVKSKSSNKKNRVEKPFNLMYFFMLGLFLFFIAYFEGEHLWKFVHDIFLGFFGSLALFIGPVYIFIAVFYSLKNEKSLFTRNIYEIFLFILIICAIIQTYDYDETFYNLSFFERLQNLKLAWISGLNRNGGGIVGEFINLIFSYFFGRQIAFLIFWFLLFVLFFTVTGINFANFIKFLIKPLKNLMSTLFNKNIELYEKTLNKNNKPNKVENVNFNSDLNVVDLNNELKNDENFLKNKTNIVVDKNEVFKEVLLDKKNVSNVDGLKIKNNENSVDDLNSNIDFKNLNFGYSFPSINLLNKPNSGSNVDVSTELKVNALRLVDTLKSFGVETRIININRGPTVTRYELQPSAGVKISKITNLSDDISLSLAAGGVRIEAPIPNKSAVGIEVPNKKKEMVVLREIVSSEVFIKAKSSLTFALGKDIAGNVVVADIEKMPHVLIAGATGSGKSVCINSLIVSLIYKSSPTDVKFLLIDPKVVELSVYNEIPHLLIPVVTDPKKAAGALNWAVNEMLKRYKLFAEVGVRDLNSYNSMLESNRLKNGNANNFVFLPRIVVVVDELADLMMAASKEVENAICRLAQMARAAGMHLVIATQRPSVDVITGLIKANVPSRIAFTVSSQVDSRTIIDMTGAEKLLGKGDMLYFPVGEQKPIRVQGCFLSDGEVERVVESVKVRDSSKIDSYSNEIIEEIDRHVENSDEVESGLEISEGVDSMFNDAAKLVIESGQASTSFLQRKLKLGYSRAARIMDELENAGIVDKPSGAKGRKILMSKQQWLEMKLNKGD